MRLAVLVVLTLVTACGGANPAMTSPDLSAQVTPPPDLMPASSCGKPGDVGNSLGVGQYCTKGGNQCNNTAVLCSADYPMAGVEPTSFCTLPCDFNNPSTWPARCGAGATCHCSTPVACGCAPASCVRDGGA